MSPSLIIDCQWIDQPAATDLLEQRTWACLAIRMAGRPVTRLWDRTTQTERSTLFLPAFPIARWIVGEWWAMLHEPKRNERLTAAGRPVHPSQLAWFHRHCLRSAESGFLLPRLFIYSDGENVCLEWTADDEDAYEHMPGYFVGSDLVVAGRGQIESALMDFVSRVVSRLDGNDDPRARSIRENWQAVLEADEAAFCRAAGRMGLDPYSYGSWDADLLRLLETEIGDDPDRPLVEDFLEATEAPLARATWKWVTDAERALALGSGRLRAPDLLSRRFTRAASAGYELARRVRERAQLDPEAPVGSLPDLVECLRWGAFSFEARNHVPAAAIRAAVGWRKGQEAVVAGPEPRRADNRRFLEARGLYHAVFGCERGPRLITDAHTWDQQVSRAFAAELLAPREGLLRGCRPNMNPEEFASMVRDLAHRYRVSTQVIDRQLENSGITVPRD